jgi:hypothetical protein
MDCRILAKKNSTIAVCQAYSMFLCGRVSFALNETYQPFQPIFECISVPFGAAFAAFYWLSMP